eukprot:859052-Rhodomonas_salina.1
MSLPQADTEFGPFLALMEGQWEARDTINAELAGALVAFLTADGRKTHDGTKATLNIFSDGRYAHPLEGSRGEWETEEGVRLPDIVPLSQGEATFVGYKLFNKKQ